jgi:hypothetical protein
MFFSQSREDSKSKSGFGPLVLKEIWTIDLVPLIRGKKILGTRPLRVQRMKEATSQSREIMKFEIMLTKNRSGPLASEAIRTIGIRSDQDYRSNPMDLTRENFGISSIESPKHEGNFLPNS